MGGLHRLLALSALAATAAHAAAAPLPPSPFPPCTADQQTVKDRLLAPLLPLTPASAASKAKAAASLQASQLPDGSWVDVNYADKTRGTWAATVHLSRLKTMAGAVRAPLSPCVNSSALLASTNKGLSYWVKAKLTNPNWYWNEIGVPQLLVDIFLLLEGRGLASGDVSTHAQSAPNLIFQVTSQLDSHV